MSARNHEHFPCNSIVHPCRLYHKCDGTCFQRNFYPFRIPNRMFHTMFRPCLIHSGCNSTIHCSFQHFCQCETMKNKGKLLDPCSYSVTVRQISSLHVAMPTTEVWQRQKSRDSTRTSPVLSDHKIVSSLQRVRTTATPNTYENEHVTVEYQNSPSVPTMKHVTKNSGIEASSTSFITTSDEQKSSIVDQVSEINSEQSPIHSSRFLNVEQSEVNHLLMSKINSTISDKNIDYNVNKLQMTKQIATKHHLQNSSDNPHSNIDIEESSPLKLSHNNTPNERANNNTSLSSIDNSHLPVLPLSLAPNINHIKSNEMFVHISQSNKSISTLNEVKQKSLSNTIRSNTSLRTTRSTIDFGFLIHETNT